MLNWNQKAKVLILPQTFALLIKYYFNQDLFLDLQRDLAPKLKKDSRDISYIYNIIYLLDKTNRINFFHLRRTLILVYYF